MPWQAICMYMGKKMGRWPGLWSGHGYQLIWTGSNQLMCDVPVWASVYADTTWQISCHTGSVRQCQAVWLTLNRGFWQGLLAAPCRGVGSKETLKVQLGHFWST